MNTTSLISTNELTTGQAAVVGGFLGTLLTLSIIVAVLLIIAGWKIFEKVGEKGWKVLIPIYDVYILFKICGLKQWFWPFFITSLVASIMYTVNTPEALNNMASDADINQVLSGIDWSAHVPFIIGGLIECAVSIATVIMVSIRLAKAFGKGVGYTLGLIFFPNIFTLILGFGKAKYSAKNLDK